MSKKDLQILLGKPGLDGHDVGVKVLGHALVEAGFGVVYTGLRKPIESIVRMAKENDVDVVGLSILSGTHIITCKQMKEEMQKNGLTTPWIVGGNIPENDIEAIKEIGATAAFATGTKIDEVIDFCSTLLEKKKKLSKQSR